MNGLSYHILPFEPAHQVAAMKLEKGIYQGNAVQLEILKEHFLSRAFPFDDYYAAMAMTDGEEIIGSAIGASTRIRVNDKEFEAGFAFDTKVNPDWRGHHVGSNLARTLYRHFFYPRSLDKTFMTAKTSNNPVLKLASSTVAQTWSIPFVYLTLPTSVRIKTKYSNAADPSFKISLFNKINLDPGYFTELENGLGYFNTYKAYRLRIRKLSWPLKKGISILKFLFPSKYGILPREQDELSFAILYNHDLSNLPHLNFLLEKLQSEGIAQLLVCCSQHDGVYKILKNKSINTYPYSLVSDFEIKPTDKITIDVRCL